MLYNLRSIASTDPKAHAARVISQDEPRQPSILADLVIPYKHLSEKSMHRMM
jgi:hypothetical protein